MARFTASRDNAQRWQGFVDGRRHRVERTGTLRHRIEWSADNQMLAVTRTWLPRVWVQDPAVGRLRITTNTATLHPFGPGADSAQGIALTAEPGSQVARREEEILHRPVRFAMRQVLTAAAAIVIPLAVIALFAPLARLLRHIGIDLPALPAIPFSGFDLTDLGVPEWVQSALDSSDYVIPLVAAVVVVWLALARRKRLITGSSEHPRGDGDEQ